MRFCQALSVIRKPTVGTLDACQMTFVWHSETTLDYKNTCVGCTITGKTVTHYFSSRGHLELPLNQLPCFWDTGENHENMLNSAQIITGTQN